MINFETIYKQAISSKHISIKSNTEDTFNFFPKHSDFSLQNLFYLNYAGYATNHYPYSIKSKPIDSYLMVYTFGGQGIIHYNNNKYILKKNSYLFIDCRLEFTLEIFNSSSWSYKWLYLNGNIIPKLYDHYIKNKNYFYTVNPLSNINTYFSKLIKSCQPGISNDLLQSMLINDLMITYILEKQAEEDNSPKIPAYILKMKDLFDNKYYNTYTLQNLAKEFRVSKYTLSREFTKHIHTPPIEYLINKRISIAKELLSETNISVNEISQKIGIENSTHFINLFKSRVGITPLQYRNQKLQ